MNAENLLDVAYHSFYGEDWERAYEINQRAGRMAFELGNYDNAFELYSRSLTALNELSPSEREANLEERLNIEMGIIRSAFTISKYTDAKDHCEAALLISRQIDARREEAEILFVLGQIDVAMGNYSEAMKNFEVSGAIAEDNRDPVGVASAHRGMGDVSRRTGDFDSAIEHFDKTIDMLNKLMEGGSKEKDNIVALGKAFLVRGILEEQAGRHESAGSDYLKAVSLFEKIGYEFELAHAVMDYAAIFWHKADWDAFIDKSREGIEYAERSGNLKAKLYNLLNLSEGHMKKYESMEEKDDMVLDSALLTLVEAEDLFKYLSEVDVEYAIYDRYTILYRLKERWAEAVEYSDRSIGINEAKNAKPELANSYRMRGEIHRDKGEAGDAKDYLERALAIYEELGNESMVNKVRETLSKLK